MPKNHRKYASDVGANSPSGSSSNRSGMINGTPVELGKGGHNSHAVLAHAFETFGSREKADHWLRRPNHVFKGRAPLEMVEIDPQAVEIELTRIDHGVYV